MNAREKLNHSGATGGQLTSSLPLPTVTIRPSKGWAGFNLKELWDYRELLYFLIWRDIKVRYRQTVFGALWAIIQPLMLMIVFSIFLGRLAGVSSDGVPYPLFTFSALVPWTLFSQVLVGASNSLVGNANLISKIYFPRLLLPLAASGSFVIDFLIALTVLIGMIFYYGFVPTQMMVWLPAFAILAFASAMAVGLWAAAVNVRYRDVRHALPFIVQFWLFASPVAYSTSLVPEKWKNLYALNPMTGVIEGFRWSLLGTGRPPLLILGISSVTTLVTLIGGVAYFRRVERTFADVV